MGGAMEEQRVSLWYDLVTNRLNVLDIAVPLRIQIPPDETLDSAYKKALLEWTREDSVVLVRDQSRIHGYLTFNDEFFKAEFSEMVGKKVKPITCDMLITSTTPLLEFVPLLRQRPFYFVIDRNEITHIVWFRDVDKAPMQLCLFSLCLELESEILEVLKFHPKGISHFLQKLTKGRMEKAKEVCKQKYGKETDDYLLMSTNFADKHKMLRVDSRIYGSLPFNSHKKADSFFNCVERVRNQIAHSDSILLILHKPESFCDFIETCRKIISTLRQVRFEE
jgi:hypothetical protein